MTGDTDDDGSELVSKTRRKKEAHQQQQLGERLANLKPAELEQLQLPDILAKALAEYRRLPNSFGARRRQLQYIGKLMRDADCQAIETHIAVLQNPGGQAVHSRSAVSEAIADEVLAGGEQSIEQLINRYPQLERQPLRQFLLEYQRASEDRRERSKARLVKHLDTKLATG